MNEMKKTAIALAVLGTFAGAASAQSSVTLYGRAEANVTYNERGSSLAGNSQTALYDGGANTGIGGSRFGFRGVEDLGGGLKAFFVLEAGYNIDTGASASTNANTGAEPTAGNDRLFSRLSYVGLSDSWGEVALGRQETVSRQVNNVADASGLGEIKVDEVIVLGAAANSGTATNGRAFFQSFGQRQDNAVTYTSPSFGGFKSRVMVAMGENSTGDYYGIQGSYTAGPLNVAYGFDTYSSPPNTFSGNFNQTHSIGANYNFGVATLYAGFKNTGAVGNQNGTLIGGATKSGTTVDSQEAWNVGVMVPFGAWQFRAQYIQSDYDLYNGASEDITKYGVSARYALSKRTTAYGAWTGRDGSSSSLAAFNKDFFAQENAFTVGMAHTF
jgi:GBP family porin